jgi:hypothetical protein
MAAHSPALPADHPAAYAMHLFLQNRRSLAALPAVASAVRVAGGFPTQGGGSRAGGGAGARAKAAQAHDRPANREPA